MQEFLADLHIHSRFSRATSKKLDLPLLAAWAGIKGISVLGTGDFTHPVWRREIADLLEFEEASGLFRLKNASLPALALPEGPQPAGKDGAAEPVRFMLQGEISSIYKRGGKVRKVHNLVYMPNLEAAEAFCRKLEAVGNLSADGRPILGLDSRDLLEMTLEASPEAFLIPAHIWTPWFSVFGSKSGFDRLEDCYGDLTSHIFALETGLSSDPSMIRLVSGLDKCRLVSNSDAHSGENLGREANLFAGNISWNGLVNALKSPADQGETRFLGTVEFFPEEGKYHKDGHRKCNVSLEPEETRALGGKCPVCGEDLTVGVHYRVMELADRESPAYQAGEAYSSLVPLPEVLGEILGVGSKARRVTEMYRQVVERFGPELTVLRETPVADLARFSPPLGESVERMRNGRVILEGGYDGEYGVIRMFSDEELHDIHRSSGLGGKKRKAAVALLLPGQEEAVKPRKSRKKEADADFTFEDADEFIFSGPEEDASGAAVPISGGAAAAFSVDSPADPAFENTEAEDPGAGLNSSQERAVTAGPGPVLVLAGPGTGKTRTLIARIEHLLNEGISARRILAVTFTRRAASELDSRLVTALGEGAHLPRTDTLHALALELWHRTHQDTPVLLSEESARQVFMDANPEENRQTLRDAWQAISVARERMEMPPPEFVEAARRYTAHKSAWNLADYTDLPEFWLEQISAGLYSSPYSHVLVDEVQDLSTLQLTLVRSLMGSSGEGFFGIGDPDQSIYGFRGANGQSRGFFAEAWPGLQVISLSHNYRSRQGIPQLAHSLLGAEAQSPVLAVRRPQKALVHYFQAPTDESEVHRLTSRIRLLLGLGSHTLADKEDGEIAPGGIIPPGSYSPGDIAVLVRTHALARPFRRALLRAGVPVADPAGDVFWADNRVSLILRSAGRMLGIAVAGDEQNDTPICPDTVLAKGPLGFAAYLSSNPPFDAVFWQSTAFKSLVKAYDDNNGWAGLITWVNLMNELELVRSKAETVQILSLHAAKGLEFPVVFMPCLEDGLLPFAGPELLTGRPIKGPGADMAEERRLFYVGLTRAKDALFLSSAGRRILYGRELRLQPSRFMESLPQEFLTRSVLVATKKRTEAQLKLL